MLLTNRTTARLCLHLSLIKNCGVDHSTCSTVGSTIQRWWIATSPGPQLGTTIATSTVRTVCICWPLSPISSWNVENLVLPKFIKTYNKQSTLMHSFNLWFIKCTKLLLLTNRTAAWLCLHLSLTYNCSVGHSTCSTVGSTIERCWIATSPGPQLGATISTSTVGTVSVSWPFSPVSIWKVRHC